MLVAGECESDYVVIGNQFRVLSVCRQLLKVGASELVGPHGIPAFVSRSQTPKTPANSLTLNRIRELQAASCTLLLFAMQSLLV